VEHYGGGLNMDKKFIPAARFHFLTALFETLLGIFGLGKKYRNEIKKYLQFSEKMKVLDAGCGAGSLAIEVMKNNPNLFLYAVDADKKILSLAKKKSKEGGIKINFQQGFLQKLPFQNNSFDVVYSSLVIHHLTTETKQKAMKEIHRILKKEGYFLLSDFGKPRNIFLSPYSWFTTLFEEGMDNYKGKIPNMLKEAGFRKVEEVGKYKFNIKFIRAEK
jgi:ubiquinone/menaquinone biosynthesis C-methylase UbiE